MISHDSISRRELHIAIRRNAILLGGNERLKIYGLLSCASGKRMKRVNRIFFANNSEAEENGYRPCGHCMPLQYNQWKLSKKQVQ